MNYSTSEIGGVGSAAAHMMNHAVYEGETDEGYDEVDEDIQMIIDEQQAVVGGSPNAATKLNETSSIGFEHLP